MGPAIEAMLTMRPALRSMKCGVIALHVRKTDFVLTAKVRSQSSSVLFVNGMPGGPAAPALLTRMSILPNDSRVRSTIVLTSAALVTSVFMARTLRPSPLTSPATFSALSTWMSGIAMSAPSRAIASTMPRPIPLPPPVTTATLPASRMETPSIYSRCPGGTHDSTPAQKPQLVRVQRPLANGSLPAFREHLAHGHRELFDRKVGVDDVAIGRLVAVEHLRLGTRRRPRSLAEPKHARHVRLRFRIRRNPSVPPDRLHARVVRRERERKVAVVAVDQVPQVADPALDVLARIEDVADAELRRRRGHELHQPARALGRYGARFEVRLHADDGFNELRGERVPLGRRADQVAVRRHGLRGDRFAGWRRRLRRDDLRWRDVPDVEHAVTLLHADLGGGRRVHREDHGDDEAGSRYQGLGLSSVHFQVAAAKHLLRACGRTTHPVGGEPDSAGRVPERDADGVAAARRAVVSHIELQGIVAGHGERRHRVGNVLDVGLAVELRLAGRGRSRTSAA